MCVMMADGIFAECSVMLRVWLIWSGSALTIGLSNMVFQVVVDHGSF